MENCKVQLVKRNGAESQSANLQGLSCYNYMNVPPELVAYGMKKKIDADTEVYLKNVDANLKSQYENLKQRNILQRIETIERNRANRELTSFDVVENSSGQLCIEFCTLEENRKLSAPILSVRKIRAIFLWAADSSEDHFVLKITWEEGGGFVLKGDEINAKVMSKKFATQGVSFRVSREKQQLVKDLTLSFLVKHAEYFEIPRYFGWNRMSDGTWKFEADVEKTLEGVIRNVI